MRFYDQRQSRTELDALGGTEDSYKERGERDVGTEGKAEGGGEEDESSPEGRHTQGLGSGSGSRGGELRL